MTGKDLTTVKRIFARCGLAAATLMLAAMPAMAEDAKVDTGDAAWMLTSTALVLMMTVPGVALFYAGMVRKKNVLATMMQSFFITALVTVLWMVAGYSIAFGDGGTYSAYVGDFSKILLSGISENWDKPFTLGTGDGAVAFTIPESIFLMFQMTFAIITAALITGAVADRMKFSALVMFVTLWTLLVYSPIAHWVWHPNGWLFGLGALDFAGGTVVHINAGVAGLVAAIVLGKRVGYGSENMAPFNLGLAVIGASLLWVGWFGFNAGSAGSSGGGRAGMAMLVTQIAAGGAVLSWTFAEWMIKGKPSVLGAISGAVAGLVAITPAAGFVLPGAALIIGLVAGLAGLWGATALKHALGYDDSLDAFGVHGICGIVGALLVGFLSYGPLSATTAAPDGSPGGMEQFIKQCTAVGATIVFTAVATFIILKITDVVIGLRVSEEEEREGLDVTMHGERIN
ncbi:ammonium transporter [Neoroseomonas oryzicola]|uniref:Ammonium transporter n=1 Tax=Neoroseomonas oryzicola TaxID=535904 RepID=A0A9X9WQ53_9PROT|nr:ammonium transporter [Neoroseomonas oryzicola]MBR0662463.1 ammonium transporter [Neoroseomonas oryzicola]NKE19493.1 ammonium transporter [Neoroseomonas oryzicola]